jgi:hypothetical protein
VYQRPGTQMGIVQSDVLAFVSRVQSEPVLKRIAKKIKLVNEHHARDVVVRAPFATRGVHASRPWNAGRRDADRTPR